MSKKINFDSLRDKIEQIRYSVSLGQKIIHEVSLPADWTETECLAAMEGQSETKEPTVVHFFCKDVF